MLLQYMYYKVKYSKTGLKETKAGVLTDQETLQSGPDFVQQILYTDIYNAVATLLHFIFCIFTDVLICSNFFNLGQFFILFGEQFAHPCAFSLALQSYGTSFSFRSCILPFRCYNTYLVWSSGWSLKTSFTVNNGNTQTNPQWTFILHLSLPLVIPQYSITQPVLSTCVMLQNCGFYEMQNHGNRQVTGARAQEFTTVSFLY